LARILRDYTQFVDFNAGRIMSGQFMVGLIIIILAVLVTSGFWRLALQLRTSNKIVRFYRMAFWAFAVLLMAMLGVMLTIADLSAGFDDIAKAAMLGLTASFVFFILFAWGRLTIVGLLYLANHTQPEA
jgi:hypothetical protein